MSLTKLTEIVKNVDAEQQVAVIMPKLSTIFKRASIELQQTRGHYGRRSLKTACAIGAIRFYLGDNEDLWQTIQTPNTPEFIELRRQMSLLDNHVCKTYGRTIMGMNDEHHWSFTRFAEECERLGI